MIIQAGGNVGIGTSTPSATLDVVGTTELNGDVSINSNLAVDTNTLFVDGTANRVGIGTITPQSPLHVTGLITSGEAGVTDGEILLENSSGFVSNNPGIRTNSVRDLILRSHSNSGDIEFETGNPESTRMVILETGRVGIGTQDPLNKLHVRANVTGDNTDANNYIVKIHNTQNNGSLSQGILALQFNADLSITSGRGNWIQFFENGQNLAGTIENNSNGNAEYRTNGSDYAEMLERLHPEEQIANGDVVGVFGGKISKRTDGAEWVMGGITGNAAVLGNAVFDDSAEALREHVSFIGQVPVRVRGAVALGDYIVASGMNDGTAVAVSPQDIAPEQGRLIVGRAWASSDEEGVKLINTVVGLPESASTTAALARTVRDQQKQLNELRNEKDAELAELRSRVDRMEAMLGTLAVARKGADQ